MEMRRCAIGKILEKVWIEIVVPVCVFALLIVLVVVACTASTWLWEKIQGPIAAWSIAILLFVWLAFLVSYSLVNAARGVKKIVKICKEEQDVCRS